ncbi:NADPH--cytochrome P450 reductase [Nymphon striatum]|nr:NADPH--cytochrome P450 reductase [Nymphon striatum]
MADDSSDHVAEAAEAEPSVTSDYQVYVVVIIAILTFIWYLKSRNNQAVNDVDIDVTDFKISESVPQVSNSALLKRMISNERKLVVFYGSQTGNAEEFANRISKESARFGIRGMVADPEETDMEELCQLKEIPDSLAVFCMATYGEGDPTDNAIEFNEWLKDTSENLAGVNYAVFGLGNKTYEHYNTMATFVDNRLEELGATRVHALGLGDDDGNMEEDFLTWKEGFWSAVCEHFNLEVSGEEFNLRQYKLITHEPDSLSPDSIYTGEVARLKSYEKQRPPFDAKNPYISKMLENRELHTGGDRSCMHVGFNITDSRVRYETGDHLALFPENDSNLVNRLGELLNVDLDQLITLLNLDGLYDWYIFKLTQYFSNYGSQNPITLEQYSHKKGRCSP